MRTRSRQGGWAGLIGILLALVIVLLLGRTLLKQMGLLTDAPPQRAAAKPGSTQVDVATPSITAPMERARALEQQVQQQARDQSARIDDATR
jgi:hypothetical protein